MNNRNVIIAFILGAAAGSVASWLVAKNKYEEIIQVENEHSREYWKNYYANNEFDFVDEDDLEELIEEEDAQWDRVEEAAAELKNEGPTIKEYAEKLATEGYAGYFDETEEEKEEEEVESMDDVDVTKPYEIPVDQFGECDGYELSSFTLYADKVLADDFDEVVENIDTTIGQDNLNSFAESEKDYVYIRNEAMKTDFEIMRGDSNYSDRENA